MRRRRANRALVGITSCPQTSRLSGNYPVLGGLVELIVDKYDGALR